MIRTPQTLSRESLSAHRAYAKRQRQLQRLQTILVAAVLTALGIAAVAGTMLTNMF